MNEYKEQTLLTRLNVNWNNAVIEYSAKLVKYGFTFGAALASLAILYVGLPTGGAEWLRAILLVITGGAIMAGFAGMVALVIKDLFFPYQQPYERIRSLDPAAAPSNMKPQPLMAQDGNQWRYGKVKLEHQRLLLLATAVLQNGEDRISQRKLADWGVVNGKDSNEAKQLKADLIYLGYGIEAGNGELAVSDALRDYLSGLFPALTPPTPHRNGVR